MLFGEGAHQFGHVGWVAVEVVGVDGDEADALGLKIGGDLSDGVGEVDDKGAVIADEHHHETLFPLHCGERVKFSVGVGEGKVGSGGSEGEDSSGGNFGHGG